MKVRSTSALLFSLVLLAPIQFSRAQNGPGPNGQQHQCRGMGMMGMSMPKSKLAEIRVIPMAQVHQNQADVTRMHELIAELKSRRERISSTDANVNEQLKAQAELLQVLSGYIERNTTDQGKSETAINIQKKLNAMEGRMMCGACHGGGGMHGGMQMGE